MTEKLIQVEIDALKNLCTELSSITLASSVILALINERDRDQAQIAELDTECNETMKEIATLRDEAESKSALMRQMMDFVDEVSKQPYWAGPSTQWAEGYQKRYNRIVGLADELQPTLSAYHEQEGK